MIFFFILFFISNMFSQQEINPEVEKEVNEINKLLREVNEEIKEETKFTKPENKINKDKNVEAKHSSNKKNSKTEESNIKSVKKKTKQRHIKQNKVDSYLGFSDSSEGNLKGKYYFHSLEQVVGAKSYAGEAGDWVFSFLYDSVSYETESRKHGFSSELSYVLDFHYLSIHFMGSLGYYQGLEKARGFFPFAMGVEALLGLPSFGFIGAFYTYEYTKQEANDFYLFSKMGLSLYFNLSSIDEKAEFQMYKNYKIRRTYLIIKYAIRSTTEIEIYPKNSISIGFAFEY